jgi:hypothetical protein
VDEETNISDDMNKYYNTNTVIGVAKGWGKRKGEKRKVEGYK